MPLVEAAKLYSRVLVALLAAAGLAALFAMQLGWLTPTDGNHGEARGAQAEAPGGLGPAGILAIEGEQQLFSKNPIPVKPGRLYRISGEFRVFARPFEARTTTRVYLGLDSFDENMEPVRGGRANYRFPARNTTLSSSHGWTSLQGLISFEGEGRSRFHDDTSFVAPGVWVNRGTDTVVEIRNIEFAEIVELDD